LLQLLQHHWALCQTQPIPHQQIAQRKLRQASPAHLMQFKLNRQYQPPSHQQLQHLLPLQRHQLPLIRLMHHHLRQPTMPTHHHQRLAIDHRAIKLQTFSSIQTDIIAGAAKTTCFASSSMAIIMIGHIGNKASMNHATRASAVAKVGAS
jgi:hypothetical protein